MPIQIVLIGMLTEPFMREIINSPRAHTIYQRIKLKPKLVMIKFLQDQVLQQL